MRHPTVREYGIRSSCPIHQPSRPTHPSIRTPAPRNHAHPRVMIRPAKRKRPESEGVGARVVVSVVTLRGAALAYAAVANLGSSDPRWRRCWRALYLAATGMVSAM